MKYTSINSKNRDVCLYEVMGDIKGKLGSSSFSFGKNMSSRIEDYWRMSFDPYVSFDPYFESMKGLSFRLKAIRK